MNLIVPTPIENPASIITTHLPQEVQDRLAPRLGKDLNKWPVFQVRSIEEPLAKRFPEAGVYIAQSKEERIAVVVSRAFEYEVGLIAYSAPRSCKAFVYSKGRPQNWFDQSVRSEQFMAQEVIQKYRKESALLALDGYLSSLCKIEALSQRVEKEKLSLGEVVNAANCLLEEDPSHLEERAELAEKAAEAVTEIENVCWLNGLF